MKKLLLSIVLLLSVANLQAQSISHNETTKNWYYIYDQDGKKIKTLFLIVFIKVLHTFFRKPSANPVFF